MNLNTLLKPGIGLLLALLLAVVSLSPALTQDEGPACNPFSSRLAALMDESCGTLMALHDQGFGFGQMMVAWRISQTSSDFTWQNLMEMHENEEGEEMGWGQIMFAHRFAAALNDPNLTADDLLDLKLSGLGWGQIRKAQAIAAADLGVDFDQAIAMMQNGMGWGEIRAELGLPEGRPPWAGPPPWAGGPHGGNNGNGNGNGNGQGQGNPGGGPPPWAGGPGGRDK